MPSERQYFVLCEDNCRFEAMTKEQIIAAIAEATGHTPQDVDAAFITKIKEKNHNTALSFWVGTQAEYNAIETKASDCFYIITDDTTLEDLTAEINDQSERISELETPQKGIKLAENVNGFDVGQTVHEAIGIEQYKVLALEYQARTSGIAFASNQTCLLFVGGQSREGYSAHSYFYENEYDAYFKIRIQENGFILTSCGSTNSDIEILMTAVYGVM